MRQTIDVIVEASEYPLSIIIVGIGNSNFENMDVLDADEFELVDSNGKAAVRDIVQFVKYKDFSGDIGCLAEQVLCEVPDQLVSYMVANNKAPTASGEEPGDKKREKAK